MAARLSLAAFFKSSWGLLRSSSENSLALTTFLAVTSLPLSGVTSAGSSDDAGAKQRSGESNESGANARRTPPCLPPGRQLRARIVLRL